MVNLTRLVEVTIEAKQTNKHSKRLDFYLDLMYSQNYLMNYFI